ARDVYRRSTILLGGGIVMAFVGVALFYITLPTSVSTTQSRDAFLYYDLQSQINYLRRQNEDLRSRSKPDRDDASRRLDDSSPFRGTDEAKENQWLLFASRSLRPTGMLIFMEGIAWFLLRQYRVLIEEYKAFLRVYLKRSSYLIA